MVARSAAEESSDKISLEQVFREHLGRLKRIAAGMGFDAGSAEDILQDVYLAVMQQKGGIDDADEMGRYLYRTTVNRCLQEYRRRKRFRRSAENIIERWKQTRAEPLPPDRQLIKAEELQAVRGALEKLDAGQQAPLVLRYFCELNATQIGQILKLNPATVRSRLRQGRLMLARELIKEGK